MKFIKGNQTSKLDDLELCKLNLVRDGQNEGIWIRQDDGEVILQNHALVFLPFPSWGVVLKSEHTTKTKTNQRERVDVTDLLSDENAVITLHPEAWDNYIKNKHISEDGTPLEKVKFV